MDWEKKDTFSPDTRRPTLFSAMVMMSLLASEGFSTLKSISMVLPRGGFRGEGAVVYHGPAAGEYLQRLHSVGVSRPSVVAPVQVAPLYRYGRLVRLVDDAPVIRLRVGTGPRIDIECGACRSRIAQRVVHRQGNGFRQGIRTVRHADCDAEVGIVIRLHLHRVGEGVPCVRHDGVILGTVHLHAASGDGEPCLGQCGRTVVDGVVEHRVVLPVGELFRHVVHAHSFTASLAVRMHMMLTDTDFVWMVLSELER